jgi:hypothetical protein
MFIAWHAGPVFAQAHPGLVPFTPARIQWLALQAQVTYDHAATTDEPYTIKILTTDSETLTVYVRYNPILDQANSNDFSLNGIGLQATHNGMVLSIKHATEGIRSLAKASGWTWLKVREDIKNYKQVTATSSTLKR